MKKAAILVIAFLGVSIRPLYAVDLLDVFKFYRNPEVKLQQENVPPYDPAQPHGVVSPLTAYIGQVILRLASVKSIKDAREFHVPDLKPGESMVEFVDPRKFAVIEDKVARRNYVGVMESLVVSRNVEDVFKMSTDYNHLAQVLPGLKISKIVDRQANRVDVETWRDTELSIFGTRKNYSLITNIIWPTQDTNKKIIKSQLLRGDEKNKKYQGVIFMDSVWYFESCGEQCTHIFYMGFSLLGFDYQKTPPFFPFMSKEIRKKIVSGVTQSGAISSLAAIVRWEDARFRDRDIASFTADDKKIIDKEVKVRLKKLKKQGRIRIDWEAVFS